MLEGNSGLSQLHLTAIAIKLKQLGRQDYRLSVCMFPAIVSKMYYSKEPLIAKVPGTESLM